MNFLVKQLLKSKMKGIPEAEQERLVTLVEKNPALFQKIAAEIHAKIKNGQDQMKASVEVMESYRGELEELLEQ